MARGGKHTADNLRAFMHVRCQAKAKYGVFITNHKVTGPQTKGAVRRGGVLQRGCRHLPAHAVLEHR